MGQNHHCVKIPVPDHKFSNVSKIVEITLSLDGLKIDSNSNNLFKPISTMIQFPFENFVDHFQPEIIGFLLVAGNFERYDIQLALS